MAKEDNLTMMGQALTTERAQEIGSKGGKASAEAKRKRKAIREQFEMLLELPLKDKEAKKKLKKLGINADELNNQMAMVVRMYKKAMSGDVAAFKEIRDTIGEKPIDQIENINPPVINIERPTKKND